MKDELNMPIEPDWRAICKKYIEHIVRNEGVDFIYEGENYEMTVAEADALRALRDETQCDKGATP